MSIHIPARLKRNDKSAQKQPLDTVEAINMNVVDNLLEDLSLSPEGEPTEDINTPNTNTTNTATPEEDTPDQYSINVREILDSFKDTELDHQRLRQSMSNLQEKLKAMNDKWDNRRTIREKQNNETESVLINFQSGLSYFKRKGMKIQKGNEILAEQLQNTKQKVEESSRLLVTCSDKVLNESVLSSYRIIS